MKKWNLKNKHKDILLGGALLLCAAGIGAEYALQALSSASMCTTSGCGATSGYFRLDWFGEERLLLFAGMFLIVLFGLFRLGSRADQKKSSSDSLSKAPAGYYAWALLWSCLAGALAFDGALMGYQVAAPEAICWSCAAMAVGLIIVCAAAAYHRGSWLAFVVGIAIWSGGFSANFVLDHTLPGPGSAEAAMAQSVSDTQGMPGLHETAYASQSFGHGDGTQYFLFFSFNCGFCEVVLFNLATNQPRGQWFVASLDRDWSSKMRLASVLERQGENNIFALTLQAKQSSPPKEIRIPKTVEEATQAAAAYFTMAEMQGVPSLIVRKPNGVQLTMAGIGNIEQYLKDNNLVQQWTSM